MSDNNAIEFLITPAIRDLGEFTVRRSLPDRRRQRVGPFVFFDHMGPAEFAPDTGVNVRSHPHIGLATITYLFEGEILHRDSLGFVQAIQPNAVNWMTAGKGIVHSEKTTDEIRTRGQKLHGIQAWVALPAEREEIDPRFEHYAADMIPRFTEGGVDGVVIIGSAYGETSPVQTESETVYVEANLEPGAVLSSPAGEELAVYVVTGDVLIDGQEVSDGVLAILKNGQFAEIQGVTQSKLMILGGDTLEGERIVWWNFVSSSRERIEKAKKDWAARRFDGVPGETDFIPLPDKVLPR